MIKALLQRGLRIIGLNHQGSIEIFQVLSRERKVLFASLLLALGIPLIELGLVSAMFAIVSGNRNGGLWGIIQELFGVLGLELTSRAIIYVLLGFCILGLGFLVNLRLLHKRLNLGVNIRTYLHYSRSLVDGFLNAPLHNNTRLNRNEISNALYAEVWEIGALVYNLLGALSNSLSAIVLIAGAFFISPIMTLGAVALSLMIGLLFKNGYRKHRSIVDEKISAQTELLGRVTDVLDGYRPIRLAGAEETFINRLEELFYRTTRWRTKLVNNQTLLMTLSHAFVYMLMFVVVVLAVLVTHDLGGKALVILVLMQRVLSSLSLLQQDWLKVQGAVGATERVLGLLGECSPCEKETSSVSVPVSEEPIRSVVFENVSFTYDSGPALYRDLNLRLGPGDRVLIQGPSGIGKSTLGLLACGMLKPSAGRVLINGEEFGEVQFRRYRPQICYISPSLHVFNLPILDNIFLAGNSNPCLLGDLIQLAGLRDLVERVGEKTPVGPDGENLSLGERQRLLLLQAFLKRPSFLILDEATSNLDLELEDRVLESLLNILPDGAIVLVIAHKRPRLLNFTHAYTLREGELVFESRVRGSVLKR